MPRRRDFTQMVDIASGGRAASARRRRRPPGDRTVYYADEIDQSGAEGDVGVPSIGGPLGTRRRRTSGGYTSGQRYEAEKLKYLSKQGELSGRRRRTFQAAESEKGRQERREGAANAAIMAAQKAASAKGEGLSQADINRIRAVYGGGAKKTQSAAERLVARRAKLRNVMLKSQVGHAKYDKSVAERRKRTGAQPRAIIDAPGGRPASEFVGPETAVGTYAQGATMPGRAFSEMAGLKADVGQAFGPEGGDIARAYQAGTQPTPIQQQQQALQTGVGPTVTPGVYQYVQDRMSGYRVAPGVVELGTGTATPQDEQFFLAIDARPQVRQFMQQRTLLNAELKRTMEAGDYARNARAKQQRDALDASLPEIIPDPNERQAFSSVRRIWQVQPPGGDVGPQGQAGPPGQPMPVQGPPPMPGQEPQFGPAFYAWIGSHHGLAPGWETMPVDSPNYREAMETVRWAKASLQNARQDLQQTTPPWDRQGGAAVPQSPPGQAMPPQGAPPTPPQAPPQAGQQPQPVQPGFTGAPTGPRPMSVSGYGEQIMAGTQGRKANLPTTDQRIAQADQQLKAAQAQLMQAAGIGGQPGEGLPGLRQPNLTERIGEINAMTTGPATSLAGYVRAGGRPTDVGQTIRAALAGIPAESRSLAIGAMQRGVMGAVAQLQLDPGAQMRLQEVMDGLSRLGAMQQAPGGVPTPGVPAGGAPAGGQGAAAPVQGVIEQVIRSMEPTMAPIQSTASGGVTGGADMDQTVEGIVAAPGTRQAIADLISRGLNPLQVGAAFYNAAVQSPALTEMGKRLGQGTVFGQRKMRPMPGPTGPPSPTGPQWGPPTPAPQRLDPVATRRDFAGRLNIRIMAEAAKIVQQRSGQPIGSP